MAIFPKKKFTKDRPRRSADDEHHFEGGSLATRKLDSANERLLARPRRAPGGEARAADASRGARVRAASLDSQTITAS